ncbi:DNA alkylation repair protein [Rhodocytophaga aerolata]|uniref:DNA alkylation repair protein n=1 Tax=Rhodocytophaga aerolata TaxID=455078 RepID=A0ABT8RB75_9BACT|nr:DNA alkylation repair protein [Rhodocytophaga aerolata]MDO1448554.1 DNA alkylation repair protein [Rhodocytophaga aerolata]
MEELKKVGREATKNILLKHGAREPLYGVKVEDLKKLQRKIKSNPALALQLYDTTIADAMYLAGLITHGSYMTKQQLQKWVEEAYWPMLSEYTVPKVAAENIAGFELALEWIQSSTEHIAAAGWSTLAILAEKSNPEPNRETLQSLLHKVKQTIHLSPNRVRYTMNGFIIAVGSYVHSLSGLAEETGRQIGKVTVDMGGTACKVPYAPDYIQKVKEKKAGGKKRQEVN